MAFSAIQIIEQQANAYFDNFANTLDDLQRLYDETGDVQALECRERLLARYQSKPFLGDPASDNNGKSEGRVFMRGDPESSPKAKRGRKSHAGEKVTKAFKYNVRDMRLANRRLSMLYNALLAFGWIREDTQQQTFIDLFSGGDCSHRIVWMDDVNTLADLFRRLVSVEGFVAVQSPYGLWQMVDGHFWEKEGNKPFGNERLRKTHTPQEKSRHIDYLVNILNPRVSEQQLMEMLSGEMPEEEEEPT
jgi:hypothetical protein